MKFTKQSYISGHWYQSLEIQVIVAMFSITLLMVLGTGKLTYYLEAKSLKTELMRQSQSKLNVLNVATLEAVISEDIPILDSVFSKIIKSDPDIESIDLFNENQNLLYHWQRNSSVPHSRKHLFSLNKAYQLEGEFFGEIKLQWDQKRLLSEIDEQILYTQVLTAFILIVLTLMILLAIRILVIKPFKEINKQIINIANGELEHRLPLKTSSEISNMIRSVNELSRVLKIEQKNKEALEKAHTELKMREKDLSKAVIVAAEANKAKSSFLATISHEIRTPMNAIIGTIGLLKGTLLNQEQTQFIDTAEQSATSLLHIINDILDFSKIENDKVIIERKSFSIRDMMVTCKKILASKAQSQSDTLYYQIDDDVPDWFISDSGKIQQILINLLNNAIKFTKYGDIRLMVSLHKQENNQALLKFEIIDTGIGIKKEDQCKLFDPFSQLDQQSNRRFEGTGLGLAISKKLVTLLGGEINVISSPEQGSNFWFTVSVEIDNSPVINTTAQAAQKKRLEPGLNILLVEDSPANIVVASAILEKAGHTVTIAKNGIQAIDTLTKSINNLYDVILMDVMMPEMDGIEATTIIRRMPEPCSKIPIIAVTANAIKTDQELCLRAGMNDYISKPYQANDLLDKLFDNIGSDYTCDRETDNEPQKYDIETMQDNQLPWMAEKVLKKLAEDTSEELLPEMVKIFIDEMNRRFKSIQIAYERKLINEIANEAHALKSSAGTYGALKLQSVAKSIDSACKANEFQKAFLLVQSIQKIIPKTIEVFKQKYST